MSLKKSSFIHKLAVKGFFFFIFCDAVIKLISSIISVNSLACRLFLQSVEISMLF